MLKNSLVSLAVFLLITFWIDIYIYRVGGIQSRQPHLSRSARRTSKTSINEWNSLSVASLFHSTCLAYSTAVPEVVDEATSTPQLYLTPLPCPLSLYRTHSTQLMIACSRTTSSLCNKLNCLQFPLVVIVIVTKFICLLPENCASWRFQGPQPPTNMGEIFAFTEWFSSIWQARRVSPHSLSLSLSLLSWGGLLNCQSVPSLNGNNKNNKKRSNFVEKLLEKHFFFFGICILFDFDPQWTRLFT